MTVYLMYASLGFLIAFVTTAIVVNAMYQNVIKIVISEIQKIYELDNNGTIIQVGNKYSFAIKMLRQIKI